MAYPETNDELRIIKKILARSIVQSKLLPLLVVFAIVDKHIFKYACVKKEGPYHSLQAWLDNVMWAI